jgi:heptosyltransferase-2
MGDVLRTTSILPPLKTKYKNAHITWCTRKQSKDLLKNEFIDEIIIYEEDAALRLQVEKFNLVINLDSSKVSSALSSMSKGDSKVGFVLDAKGCVIPKSKPAEKWLLMSAFDDVKRANQKTYQEIVYELLELTSEIALPVFNVINEEKSRNSLIEKYKLNSNTRTIGLNTGVGNKWPSKGWPSKKWEELISLLGPEYNILIMGGPDESEINNYLSGQFDYAINTGCDNSIADFTNIVNLCDLVITCDSFALHIATALNKEIIALFGPTSYNEIYLYNKGIKLKADQDCDCYYKMHCEKQVSCMEKISAETVFNSIMKLL